MIRLLDLSAALGQTGECRDWSDEELNLFGLAFPPVLESNMALTIIVEVESKDSSSGVTWKKFYPLE